MTNSERLSVAFLAGRDAAHPRAGGGDLQAWAWARWLAARGHDVHYICQSGPDLARPEDIDGVHIARLGTGASLPMRARRYLRSAGQHIDLVYEDPIGAGRPPYLSPLWAGTPVIAVWHQVSRPLLHEMYPRYQAAALSTIERAIATCYRRCHFWAPSEETAESVTQTFGFESDRMHVIYPTSEVSGAARRTQTLRHNILALGLYRRYKAFDHAIHAMPTVLSSVPDARLTIAGRRSDDDYAQELHDLAHDLDVTDHVSFRFDLTDEEKQIMLASTDLMVVPSRLEGYGIVVIEANRNGTPVIVSSGVPLAAVTDGVNGLRYEYGDTDMLAKHITRCLTDEDTFASLAAGCRTHAQQRTIDTMSPRFESLIDTALRAGSSFPARHSIRKAR